MRCQWVLMMSLLVVVLPGFAAEPVPELQRPTGSAQAVGVVHTLRQIPEACVRMEGAFTGEAAAPYRFALLRSSPTCQPRARFVDFAKAHPSEAGGWKLNDIIRVPSAACASQQAVVRVWRKPVQLDTQRDGQGQSRIYLDDAKQQAAAGKVSSIPMYTAQMTLEGHGCR
jgi:hypothetical protein